MKAIITRIKRTFSNAPDGKDELVFEFASLGGSLVMLMPGLRHLLGWIGRMITILLQSISPAMTINIRGSGDDPNEQGKRYWTIFFYAYPLTVFFCLGINALLAWQVGTLWQGEDVNRVYFSTDWHNLLLYTVICPSYVCISICSLVTAALNWKTLNEHSNFATKDTLKFSPNDSMRVALFLAVSFLISGLFISGYIDDLTNPAVTTKTYWFFNEAGSGERILNTAGGYYLFLNAVLLFTTALAAFSYITMSIEAFRLGRYIDKSRFSINFENAEADNKETVQEKDKKLKKELANYSLSYMWAKALLLVYAFNVLIWQKSPAGQVANVNAAIVMLLVIGLFFLAIPRLYLGSKWHHLKVQHNERMKGKDNNYDLSEVNYTDVRTTNVRKIAGLLNGIYASTLGIILVIQYNWSGFGGYLDGLLK